MDSSGLQEWFDTWDGEIAYELRDIHIVARGDLAFCHGLVWIGGTKVDGEQVSVWTRATLCLSRTEGAWRIAHEHMSVPFYMDGSDRAAVDLEP